MAVPAVAILDDEPRMRIALGRLLRSHGFEVILFPDGDSFLAEYSRRPLAAVLLDLHMPGLDGFAILEALAGRPSRLPVIVITGHDESGTAARVAALGAAAYLLKPVDERPLLEALRRVLSGRVMAEPAGE